MLKLQHCLPLILAALLLSGCTPKTTPDDISTTQTETPTATTTSGAESASPSPEETPNFPELMQDFPTMDTEELMALYPYADGAYADALTSALADHFLQAPEEALHLLTTSSGLDERYRSEYHGPLPLRRQLACGIGTALRVMESSEEDMAPFYACKETELTAEEQALLEDILLAFENENYYAQEIQDAD